jgi:hypothetical protein
MPLMRFSYRMHRLIIPLLLSLCGCASQSELTSIRLDPTHPKYATKSCRDSIHAGQIHKDIKTATMVASPALIVLSGGLLLPLVAMNAGFDTADRMDASEMAALCGGRAQKSSEIATDVAVGAAMGAAAGIPVK